MPEWMQLRAQEDAVLYMDRNMYTLWRLKMIPSCFMAFDR
jgi:hypothetical protein